MEVKRVAIDGPESTGKSILASQLASRFEAGYVDEAARNYLKNLDRPYRQADLLEIALLQCNNEDIASKNNSLIFCDTTLLVIKVWSEYVYGNCDEIIEREFRKRKYNLHLLTNIDLPWEDDPLREHPHERTALFNIYHNYMKELGVCYEIVTGLNETRLMNAISYCKVHIL